MKYFFLNLKCLAHVRSILKWHLTLLKNDFYKKENVVYSAVAEEFS